MCVCDLRLWWWWWWYVNMRHINRLHNNKNEGVESREREWEDWLDMSEVVAVLFL